ALQKQSSFLVLSTKPLGVRATVRLKGDFGFDALSPQGRIVYLIQHVSAEDLFQYRVRAYDLRAGKLLTRVVADKRQQDWNMNGYPIARASSSDGNWVYTLYSNPNNYPFVHALDTVHRTAVCIGIPWDWTGANQHRRAVLTRDLESEGGTVPGVADRVLDEVLREDAQHPRPQR